MFQQFARLEDRDNIDFGLRSQGVPAPERRARISAQLELMGLQGYESAYPHELGRDAAARGDRALLRAQPEVLLMDEPFGALDAQTRTLMQEELIKLARKIPRTVLFITHAVEEAVYLADRVVVMTRRPGKSRRSSMSRRCARPAAGTSSRAWKRSWSRHRLRN